MNWITAPLLPTFPVASHLDVYDIGGAARDVQLAATTLAGLINRVQVRIYLLSHPDDVFWLNGALNAVPHEKMPAQGDDVLDALLAQYGGVVKGLIVYDPALPDSINVATTLAGLRDGIVVSPELAEKLKQGEPALPILVDLRTYSWKSPLEAYRWAWKHLLKDTSTRLVAGLDPQIITGLRSLLVAERMFVYWLNPWRFLPPFLWDALSRIFSGFLALWRGRDKARPYRGGSNHWESGWLSERCLMRRILARFGPGAVHLGWFQGEQGGVYLTSRAAMLTLATDHCHNLEVWTSVQPTFVRKNTNGTPATLASEKTVQQVPTQASVQSNQQAAQQTIPPVNLPAVQSNASAVEKPGEGKVYISFTVSDGDNIQYCQHHLMHLWNDPARGSIPIGWTIAPALIQAAPAIADYYWRTATGNDEFVAGPSGAGYILPSCWPETYLPDFLALTARLMQEMNLIVLEVLDTAPWSQAFLNRKLQARFVKALAPAGVRGILSGSGQSIPRYTLYDGVPVCQNVGLAGSVPKTVQMIRTAVEQHKAKFISVYILAWQMSPTSMQQVMEELGDGYELVKPGRLIEMIVQAEQVYLR